MTNSVIMRFWQKKLRLLTLAHAQRMVIVVIGRPRRATGPRLPPRSSRLDLGWVCRDAVGRSIVVCPHVFSRTVAAVDTKRGYVGMCNGRSVQQESGVAFIQDLRRGPKIIYSCYTRCVLIRDRHPIAWNGIAHLAETY